MTDFGKSAKGPTLTDLTSVASNATNINTVATNMQDVQDVATEINASPTLRSLMNSVLNDTITLDGLTDTTIGTLTQSNDAEVLTWVWDTNTSTGSWEPVAVSAGSNVTQLSDLDVTDPQNIGDGLKWDGSAYVAASFAEIGFGGDIPSPTASGGFLRATATGTAFEMSQPVAALDSNSDTDVLAASQGKELAERIAGLPDPIVVADNTARDALTGLSVGDIVHVQSDSTVGSSGWRRWQVTAVNTTTNTWANATKIDLASQDDLRGSIIVSADTNNSLAASGNDGGAYLNLANQNIAFTNANADFGSNRIFYSNVWDTSSETLPSASTYHGMFLHDHNTGLAYFAHAGSWQALQNEITTSTALAAASLTTAVGGTDIDVRRAKVETPTISADFAGDARLYNVATTGLTFTMDDTALNEGDIITLYANGYDVTIAQDATNGCDTVKLDGTTKAHSGNITVANGSIATISVISTTGGSSLAVVAGQGLS